ncbi:hypothetical protein PG996_002960 [Apiospora saccharicola]|uniref:Uncharacterized protein n=1 Tax=Apiospora saccharicola TaxID=335842 RepID=A0ABR1WKZ8_9PEZI
MSDSLDLASTIGTWVGAGIGLIALIGIVGPALIWYASTRDKQKTLNAIGKENNGYLSRGYHLGPNIWLGRRVRAPVLREIDTLKTFEALPKLDSAKIIPFKAEPSWVAYGSLLEAYGIPFEKGDSLFIMNTGPLLPLHPSWILVIGLLGRYSDRKNQVSFFTGKVPRYRFLKSQRTGTRRASRPPGSRSSFRLENNLHIPAHPVSLHGDPDQWDDVTVPAPDVVYLYGATGFLSLALTRPPQAGPLLQLATFGLNAGVGLLLFAAAADDLPQYLFRLDAGLEWLGPNEQDKQKLSTALRALSNLNEETSGERMYRAAQKLDESLGEMGNQDDLVFIDHIIGILAITNVEFRDLVYESLRNPRETASLSVELEIPSATLKVPIAFGVVQHFYVDWQEMALEQSRNRQTLQMSYSVIVLAATRSLVRCIMLRNCPDSRPLLDAVLDMDDVVYTT